VNSLELGNAMLMAGLSRKAVDLPLDGDAYDAFILELDKKYGGQKKVVAKPGRRGICLRRSSPTRGAGVCHLEVLRGISW
jgi:hypothetical protein